MGPRPETIRTRLARFMPNRVSAGWSVTWSTLTERAEEIANDDELRAEHLGCYGSAVAHALGQAEIYPTRLRVTAEAAGVEIDAHELAMLLEGLDEKDSRSATRWDPPLRLVGSAH
jgi:hypothetical protein